MHYQISVSQFIEQNGLLPGDAVALTCPDLGFPTHYALFLDNANNNPRFIANITDGIQIISGEKLNTFLQRYHVTDVERFTGGVRQRQAAIRKALKRLGEKTYSLVFNNCEHFKNWVLYGESKSKQVENIGTTLLAGGFGLVFFGTVAKNKGIQKMGAIILLTLLTIVLIAAFCLPKRDG